jgi:diguanylate cyclase (GGDEF)-like protein/PAS domain S-box-containing protein
LVVLITWRERANVSVSSGRNFQEPEHHTLVEQIPAIVYVQKLDPIRSTTYLSPQTGVLLGYSPDELRGEVRRWLEIIHPDDRERVDAEVNRAVSAGESSGTEYRCIARDGRVVWVRDEAVIAEDDQGCPRFRRGILFDITEYKQIEEELRRSENRLAAAQRIAHVGSWEYSVDEDEAYWSDEMYRIFGLSPRDFDPKYKMFLRFVHPDDEALVRKTVREVLYVGKNPSLDYRVVRPDGEVRSVRTQYEVLRDESGRPSKIVGTVHDVTERKALEERLEHQAFHDSLTGLPNRTLFMDRLGHALARVARHEKSIAVLFLDLDDFKLVNDSLGHEVGDRLLVEVAGRLKECVRPQDTVARLGGDEFTVLLEEVENVDGATHVVRRVTEALRTPFDLGEDRLSTGVSIGGVLGNSARDRPEDLLRNADLALYEAKRRGKARYEIFDPGTNQRLAERLKLKRELGRALERDEFRVLYQPKMLLRTGRIIGTEALVRWEHPERGLIPPAEFVPLAEESGLIIPIGYKVLEEACRQARSWQERYLDAPQTMCVNLSFRQFTDPGLVEEVTKVVRETGVEPSGLALEISENVLMSDPQSTLDKLWSLRELGARVVVDDFGTAYSSLPRLGRLPMNSLNVDRSLIFRLGVVPEDTAIVAASINLAHSLGWDVTAEGVETADQLARLRELGCDMAQGYHLWEPLTSEGMAAYLATGFQW